MVNDGIKQLMDDHVKIFNLYDKFKNKSDTDLNGKKSALQQIIQDMTIHDFIEHQILYPMVREKLTTGEKMADRSLAQHKNVRKMMIDLENIDFSSESITEVNMKVDSLIRTFREHVQEEENEIFPALRSSIQENELESMYNSLNRYRSVSPTHPREDVPEGSSVTSKVSGAATGIKDKVADTLGTTKSQEGKSSSY